MRGGAKAIMGVFVALVMLVVILITLLFSVEDCRVVGGSDGGSSASGGVPDGAYSLPQANALDHVTSGFGMRWGSMHQGVDIAQGQGTPIYAFADGIVASSGTADGFGHWIVIDHEIDGRLIATVYGHMFAEGLHVKAGEQVKAGQHIADEGYDGGVSPPGPGGSHLHFEVWEGGRDAGRAVEPMPWLEQAVEPGTGGGSVSSGDAETLVIGDSLTVGAEGQIKKLLPDATIDASVGRQYGEGLARLRESDSKPGVVVMALGTNGAFSQKDVDATIDAAGGARVVLMTVGGPGVSSAGAVNELVRKNSSKVGVFDWAAKVESDPGLVGGDGVHLTPEGNTAFAKALADAAGGKTSSVATPKSNAPAPSSGGEVPPDPRFSEANMQVDTIRLGRSVAQRFPQLEIIGGWRPYDNYPDHPSGRAADIMIPNYSSAEGKQLGDDILSYLWENKEHFNVQYFIWRQEYIPAEGTPNMMEDRGDPTQNHYDHIHVTTVGGGYPKPGEKYGPSPDGGSGAMPGQASGTADDNCGSTGGVDAGLNSAEIPPEFVKWLTLAGQVCAEAPASLIAALTYQESQFDRNAVNPKSGARGSGQFMPATWQGWGYRVDDNGEQIGGPGEGDPHNPADATMASGRFLCHLAEQNAKWKAEGRISGDDRDLMLAAYNAGPGNVLNYGGVPPFPETQGYIVLIPQHEERFKEKI